VVCFVVGGCVFWGGVGLVGFFFFFFFLLWLGVGSMSFPPAVTILSILRAEARRAYSQAFPTFFVDVQSIS